MSKWNLIHSMEKLMMLSKMCTTKAINLRTEDTTTTTTTKEDLTEVEEEAEALEEEFQKDIRIQLILMVTFPDEKFVNPSIIGKTINCPDNPSRKCKGNTEQAVLYQSVLHTQEFMQQFTGEMLSVTVLDSGATSTVCGKMWIDSFEEMLSDEYRPK